MNARIGIRREDRNEFERRVPLTPEHVRKLRRREIDVVIQPSRIRIFKDEEYREAGAEVREDLAACPVVFAVKEIPVAFFRESGVYMFFSHTIKGQPYNMPALRRMLELRTTLIDYERVTDEKNRRLIFFGNYAGTAGMIESLHTLGKRLEWEGIPTPFATIRRPLDYPSLAAARDAISAAGRQIAGEGLPAPLVPLVIGFSGYGNVSRGAQEIFDLLPHEAIAPENLETLMTAGRGSANRLYKVVFYEKDMVSPRGAGDEFGLRDYFDHPERYRGRFEDYLPHLTVLINGIYWEPRYPRLVTKQWLKDAWRGSEKPRLRVLGDISCDIEGSIECTVKGAEPGNPIYTYLPAEDSIVTGFAGEGPVVMAVDTLPAELPREASTSFGSMLLPFVKAVATADFSCPFEALKLPGEIKRAVIAHGGTLTKGYQYLKEFL